MDIITLFRNLLRFKTITPNENGIYDFIQNYLGDSWNLIKLDINDTKNRFFYKDFGNIDPQSKHLCFAGHIDVVPAGDGWSTDPFEAKIQDGKIIARGAQDMKSGVAAFLYSCKHLVDFDGRISILLTSDEEGEATDGTIKVLEYLKQHNMLPTSAVVAEPTCEKIFADTIKIGRRGSINGYLKIQGKQGHAAYPQKAINPIDLIAPILPKIAGVCLDDGDEFFAPSKFVITDIRAGMQVTNVTPNELNMMFNVRNSTKTDQQKIKDFIHHHFSHLDYTLKLTQGSYPFITDKNNKIVKAMQKSIVQLTQIDPTLSTGGGTSDARFFGQYHIPTVEFGVLNDTIHAIDEYTYVSDVQKLTEIFTILIGKFNN
jgi:succinyl-diaminopimelate desuccinylase